MAERRSRRVSTDALTSDGRVICVHIERRRIVSITISTGTENYSTSTPMERCCTTVRGKRNFNIKVKSPARGEAEGHGDNDAGGVKRSSN